MLWHIYKITCTINSKAYIGLTMQGLRGRFKGHAKNARDGSDVFLHRAMRKHGIENFLIEELAECYSLKEAQICERAQIAQHGTYQPGGYNVTIGGEGAFGMKMTPEQIEKTRQANIGRKHSEESKLKRSVAMSGRKQTEEHKSKRIKATIGYKHTPEARAKMSASHTGVPLADDHLASLKIHHAKVRAERAADPEKMAQWKAACSEATKGKPKSEAHRQALKLAQERRRERERQNPEAIEQQRIRNRACAIRRWHPELDEETILQMAQKRA